MMMLPFSGLPLRWKRCWIPAFRASEIFTLTPIIADPNYWDIFTLTPITVNFY